MAKSTPDIRIANNKKYILCLIRKKWIVLTPEEKVRQYILHQLIHEQQYPQKYISVEKTLKVNELSKRYDIVVFNQSLEPKILIECKAEFIEIKEKTLQQIATYNLKLRVPFLMVTNGKNSYRFEIQENASVQISTFPSFELL
ncbi:MAG: type I restriction enzyme HsdR N-terminal domain-containing protein [Chitinophagales bacterium]